MGIVDNHKQMDETLKPSTVVPGDAINMPVLSTYLETEINQIMAKPVDQIIPFHLSHSKSAQISTTYFRCKVSLISRCDRPVVL